MPVQATQHRLHVRSDTASRGLLNAESTAIHVGDVDGLVMALSSGADDIVLTSHLNLADASDSKQLVIGESTASVVVCFA